MKILYKFTLQYRHCVAFFGKSQSHQKHDGIRFVWKRECHLITGDFFINKTNTIFSLSRSSFQLSPDFFLFCCPLNILSTVLCIIVRAYVMLLINTLRLTVSTHTPSTRFFSIALRTLTVTITTTQLTFFF